MDGWTDGGQTGGRMGDWGMGGCAWVGRGSRLTFLVLIDCSSFSISSRANVGPFSKLVPNV